MMEQTRVIEFSVHLDRTFIQRWCDSNGLKIDPNFNLNNGGVTLGLRITGDVRKLNLLGKKYGYPA
jgi:hypothetical protein